VAAAGDRHERVRPILSKVAAVLPKDLEPLLADTRLYVPNTRSQYGPAAVRLLD
jgi:hypothetical protein